MWYPVTVAAPLTEPVSVDTLRQQMRRDDSDEPTLVESMGKVARAHIEKYCGVRFASRTGVVMRCDGWSDMARLPEAPVTAISGITYIDTDGASQTLSTDVYELRSDDLEAAVVLKYNQTWPPIQLGSRITVTATVGYATIPPDVAWAIQMLAAHLNENREDTVVGVSAEKIPMGVESLLTNHRRYA